jgi:hypothetical protein
MPDLFRGGLPAEVTGTVCSVTGKTARGVPWATARIAGVALDLNLYPRLWDLYWRDIRPGTRLRVTGRVDARKPRRLAVAVSQVALLGEDAPR